MGNNEQEEMNSPNVNMIEIKGSEIYQKYRDYGNESLKDRLISIKQQIRDLKESLNQKD